mgnify:CR=1 FL=1
MSVTIYKLNDKSLETTFIGGNMQVTPLQDRVLVERLAEETKTAGGIIIPDNNKEKPAQGKIVSVGTGHRLQDGSLRALEVKSGDTVLFGRYAGTEVKVDGKDLLIMKEDDVLGIIH